MNCPVFYSGEESTPNATKAHGKQFTAALEAPVWPSVQLNKAGHD